MTRIHARLGIRIGALFLVAATAGLIAACGGDGGSPSTPAPAPAPAPTPAPTPTPTPTPPPSGPAEVWGLWGFKHGLAASSEVSGDLPECAKPFGAEPFADLVVRLEQEGDALTGDAWWDPSSVFPGFNPSEDDEAEWLLAGTVSGNQIALKETHYDDGEIEHGYLPFPKVDEDVFDEDWSLSEHCPEYLGQMFIITYYATEWDLTFRNAELLEGTARRRIDYALGESKWTIVMTDDSVRVTPW